MSNAIRRVVVIHDASRDINISAIKWALRGLSLKPGDELTFLGILHQVITPSTFHKLGAGKLLGHKIKVDSSSILYANQKIIDDEVAKKMKEYDNNLEILQMKTLYEMNQVIFNTYVIPASSPKNTALKEAKRLQATWIVLDRQMKKDKKYFMENLTCGISRMKHNNTVKLLREPKSGGACGMFATESQSSHINHNQIIPDSSLKDTATERMKENLSDDDDDELFSFDFSSVGNSINLQNTQGNSSMASSSSSSSISSQRLPFFKESTECTIEEPSSVFDPGKQAPVDQLQQKYSYKQDKIKSSQDIAMPPKTTAVGTSSGESDCNPLYKVEEKKDIIQEESLLHRATSKQTNDTMQILACSHCKYWRPNFPLRVFTYEKLQEATKGFSEENFLSEGGFGSVYKGFLGDTQQWIAVKQHKNASMQGNKEFEAEVRILNKARHDNVVMLLGSCSDGNHQLLVYEYVCNGSLDMHLSENSEILTWENRLKIAMGCAKGLRYLHKHNIIHRDVRPSNILISHDYEPLLGDFGLARGSQDECNSSSENKVVGTFGYMAPEYAETGKYSTKADVYSFGVVLLELITGYQKIQGNRTISWAGPLLEEKRYPELIDERILDSHDVHQLFGMVAVADKCLSKDPNSRPSMWKVEHALKCILNKENVTGLENFSPSRSSEGSSTVSHESETHEQSGLLKVLKSNVIGVVSNSEPSSYTQLLATALNREGVTHKSKQSKKAKNVKRRSRSHSQILYEEMLS